MDYTEFIPSYPNHLICADVTANYAYRSPPQENKHSCTPGVGDSIAMCIVSYNSCTYSAGHQASLIIEVLITPHPDSTVMLIGLEFYEKAPANYTWINGGSGPNNYPTRYGIRILKNGTEIFRNEDIQTTIDWTLEAFDFINEDEFRVDDNSLFRIELLPYCPVGNGAEVSAWDIDEIKIFGGCVPSQDIMSVIKGEVFTKQDQAISGVEMRLAENPSFADFDKKITDEFGTYLFNQLEKGSPYFVKGYNNEDALNGVSTLDLIQIQKHLLGITPFTTLDQFIAADINHNGNISVLDLVELRKLILGKYSEFPRNTSWRFGSLPQEMNSSNISQFREVSSIEYLEPDTLVMDFVGIKIGDLNGDVQLNSQPSIIESRNENQFRLIVEDQRIVPNIPFSIQIKTNNESDIAGMQFALDLNGMDLSSLTGSAIPITEENFSIIDGILRFSWSSNETIHVSSNDILFIIVLKSSFGGLLSDKIKLEEQILKPEIYLENLENVKLDFIIENKDLVSNSANFLKIEPNPIYSSASIHFFLTEGGPIEIRLIDISGRILSVINKTYLSGEYTEEITADDFTSIKGVIYCQMVSNGFTIVEKFIKLN